MEVEVEVEVVVDVLVDKLSSRTIEASMLGVVGLSATAVDKFD